MTYSLVTRRGLNTFNQRHARPRGRAHVVGRVCGLIARLAQYGLVVNAVQSILYGLLNFVALGN